MQLGEEELAEPLFDYYDYGCLTLLLKEKALAARGT